MTLTEMDEYMQKRIRMEQLDSWMIKIKEDIEQARQTGVNLHTVAEMVSEVAQMQRERNECWNRVVELSRW